jgi:integrase
MCIIFSMAFVFRQSGSKYWYAGWKDENGKRVNRSTKLLNKQANRKKALRIADEYEVGARDKRTMRQLRKTLADLQQQISGERLITSTVKDYFKAFIEMKKGEASKATVRLYETVTRDFMTWLGEEKSSEDIDMIVSGDIVKFRNMMLEKITATTANNKLKALRAIFSKAFKEGVVLEDPTSGLNLGTKRVSNADKLEKRAFTLVELKAILKSASKEWQSMIKFGLYTGQRLGDIATLRWSQIDLDNDLVRFETAKTGNRLSIPLSEPLKDHLIKIGASDDPLAFIHETLGPLYEQSGAAALSNQFVAILASCGLRKPVSHEQEEDGRDGKRNKSQLSFHCLRVTSVTMMHEAGIPAAVVEKWVGHDSSEVHKVYVKIGSESLEKASNILPRL